MIDSKQLLTNERLEKTLEALTEGVKAHYEADDAAILQDAKDYADGLGSTEDVVTKEFIDSMLVDSAMFLTTKDLASRYENAYSPIDSLMPGRKVDLATYAMDPSEEPESAQFLSAVFGGADAVFEIPEVAAVKTEANGERTIPQGTVIPLDWKPGIWFSEDADRWFLPTSVTLQQPDENGGSAVAIATFTQDEFEASGKDLGISFSVIVADTPGMYDYGKSLVSIVAKDGLDVVSELKAKNCKVFFGPSGFTDNERILPADIARTSQLAKVARTGSYGDLQGAPITPYENQIWVPAHAEYRQSAGDVGVIEWGYRAMSGYDPQTGSSTGRTAFADANVAEIYTDSEEWVDVADAAGMMSAIAERIDAASQVAFGGVPYAGAPNCDIVFTPSDAIAVKSFDGESGDKSFEVGGATVEITDLSADNVNEFIVMKGHGSCAEPQYEGSNPEWFSSFFGYERDYFPMESAVAIIAPASVTHNERYDSELGQYVPDRIPFPVLVFPEYDEEADKYTWSDHRVAGGTVYSVFQKCFMCAPADSFTVPHWEEVPGAYAEVGSVRASQDIDLGEAKIASRYMGDANISLFEYKISNGRLFEEFNDAQTIELRGEEVSFYSGNQWSEPGWGDQLTKNDKPVHALSKMLLEAGGQLLVDGRAERMKWPSQVRVSIVDCRNNQAQEIQPFSYVELYKSGSYDAGTLYAYETSSEGGIGKRALRVPLSSDYAPMLGSIARQGEGHPGNPFADDYDDGGTYYMRFAFGSGQGVQMKDDAEYTNMASNGLRIYNDISDAPFETHIIDGAEVEYGDGTAGTVNEAYAEAKVDLRIWDRIADKPEQAVEQEAPELFFDFDSATKGRALDAPFETSASVEPKQAFVNGNTTGYSHYTPTLERFSSFFIPANRAAIGDDIITPFVAVNMATGEQVFLTTGTVVAKAETEDVGDDSFCWSALSFYSKGADGQAASKIYSIVPNSEARVMECPPYGKSAMPSDEQGKLEAFMSSVVWKFEGSNSADQMTTGAEAADQLRFSRVKMNDDWAIFASADTFNAGSRDITESLAFNVGTSGHIGLWVPESVVNGMKNDFARTLAEYIGSRGTWFVSLHSENAQGSRRGFGDEDGSSTFEALGLPRKYYGCIMNPDYDDEGWFYPCGKAHGELGIKPESSSFFRAGTFPAYLNYHVKVVGGGEPEYMTYENGGEGNNIPRFAVYMAPLTRFGDERFTLGTSTYERTDGPLAYSYSGSDENPSATQTRYDWPEIAETKRVAPIGKISGYMTASEVKDYVAKAVGAALAEAAQSGQDAE